MIKPFLKLPSFDLQKPLDISLARHYNGSRGERWHLLELNGKATESTIISWKASETVKRSGKKLSNIWALSPQQKSK